MKEDDISGMDDIVVDKDVNFSAVVSMMWSRNDANRSSMNIAALYIDLTILIMTVE